jgi:hypothetical protein
MSEVPCLMSEVPCLLSNGPCLVSEFSCRLSEVSRLISEVPFLIALSLSGLIQITSKKGHLKPDSFSGLRRGWWGRGSFEVQGVGGAVHFF